ncbi:MAG: redoxin domain-containing protein [Planctomycetes bacterium]|nr:redoxin domain-containing protein [Planctomycetota bacterium]
MYSHERSLEQRHEGRPFVFLAVNSDADRTQVKQILAEENLICRCVWDGGGPEGPIATRYGVERWPTTFVLDGNGVIRYSNVHGPELDQAVETLLQELERRQ